jgi:nicotinate phosphoribosyltransferase
MIDIATRVWNHTWKIDPIVRSLLDTDFYKLLMCQSVFRNRAGVHVTFQLINRSRQIRLAELIDEGELREQLDHIRTLGLTRGESTWLRGNTFYGKRQMFSPEFMEWFERLRLPPYHLERRDGQFVLTFEGPWPEVMLWEIPALAVIMELRSRAVLKDMGRFELQILYARAMTRVWEKGQRLSRLQGLRLADFGTRRRQAPYRVLYDWQEEHEGNLRVILPDTYGTKRFLEGAPPWLAAWTGIRIDSGDPVENAEAAIRWWEAHGQDPREKLLVFSDGLDVPEIEALHARFHGRVRITFGWGTLLTNDFEGLVEDDALAPFSLVCKAVEADGRPTVKLSDNPEKAMGPREQVERYKRVFGVGEQMAREVRV